MSSDDRGTRQRRSSDAYDADPSAPSEGAGSWPGRRSITQSVPAQMSSDGGPLPSTSSMNAMVQMSSSGPSVATAPEVVVAHAEAGVASGGSSIPYQAQMEAGFGTSFADVSAHTGGAAAQASRTIGAEAYTIGSSVAFANPSPGPDLVAHELAHVVQQRAGAGPSGGVGSRGDSFEQEADHAALTVASGGQSDLAARYTPASAGAAIQMRSVQRYESGEHAMIGCGPGYPADTGSAVTLPNGASISPGEMVAFGDFYADMQQLAEAPRQEVEALIGMTRWDAVWTIARRIKQQLPSDPGTAPTPGQSAAPAPVTPGAAPVHSPGGPAVPTAANPVVNRDSLNVIAGDKAVKWIDPDNYIWDQPRADKGGLPQPLRQVANTIFNQFSPAWNFFNIPVAIGEPPSTNLMSMKATLGRRRFRGKNDTLGQSGTHDPSGAGGDYLDLATNNIAHFTPNNWVNWKKQHDEACTEYGGAGGNAQKQGMALLKDGFGQHFLTDRFSSGHAINKEDLMQYATNQMLGMAGSHGVAGGNDKNKVLSNTLEKILNTCFDDDTVRRQWNKGVDNAFDQRLIDSTEQRIMKNIPSVHGLGVGASVSQKVKGVIMDMPWRNVHGTIVADGASRSNDGGQNVDPNTPQGASAYHLGVGNVGALQVHDALNAIGFNVKNKRGDNWRMQGDSHLTDATLRIANQAFQVSQNQVKAGRGNDQEVKDYIPNEGTIDPSWVSAYFQKPIFNQQKVAALASLVARVKIPLDIDSKTGPGGPDPMMDVCKAIFDAVFTAPPSTAGGPNNDPSGTGINIEMFKDFLRERLPEMVPMAYASTSAGDLPQQALEAYAPRNLETRQILPRAAHDLTWSGHTMNFNVDVDDCAQGDYTLGLEVYDRSVGNDYDETGQRHEDVVSSVHTSSDDPVPGAQFTLTITVPAPPNGSTPVTPEGGTAPAIGPRPQISASFPVPDSAAGRTNYVMVYADAARQMVIGRSNPMGSAVGNFFSGPDPSNATPTGTAPTVTGNPAQLPVLGTSINGGIGWVGTSCVFSMHHNQPDSRFVRNPDGSVPEIFVDVWVKEFDEDWGNDHDESGHHLDEWENSDPQVAGAQKVTLRCYPAGITESATYPVRVDNDNDTYIIVYSDHGCSQPIGRSERQGHGRGVIQSVVEAGNQAAGVSGFSWNANTLSFDVTPSQAKKVYVQWWDHNTFTSDDLVGGVNPVTVESGRAIITADGDANNSGDTYAKVFMDPGCSRLLGQSGIQP